MAGYNPRYQQRRYSGKGKKKATDKRRAAEEAQPTEDQRALKHEIALVGPPLQEMGVYPQKDYERGTAGPCAAQWGGERGDARGGKPTPDAMAEVPDGTEVNAAHLQRISGGDMEHPEVRQAIELSDGGRLYCCVCGSPLRRAFGSSGTRRWHFALRDAENSACGHEPESEAHRATKTALYHALVASIEGVLREGADIEELLGLHAERRKADASDFDAGANAGASAGADSRGSAGWLVSLEKALENGRRPDVMAEGTGELSGRRVAFEVQYADMSREALAARRKDYADLGVSDLWMLGEARLEKGRDLLARELAAAEDQRLIYIGPERVIEAVSPLSGDTPWGGWDLSAIGSESKRRAERAALESNGRGSGRGRETKASRDAKHNPFYRVIASPLEETQFLSETGASLPPYHSPADGVHREMQGMYKTARRLELIEQAAARYERTAEGSPQATEARAELLGLLKEDRDAFLESAESWRLKNASREMRRVLVAQREVDLAIYASAARWKTALYGKLAEGKAEREAITAILGRYGSRERRCKWALRAFIEKLREYKAP